MPFPPMPVQTVTTDQNTITKQTNRTMDLSLVPEAVLPFYGKGFGEQYLIGKTQEELKKLVQSLEQPAFRAEQLHHWLYVKNARSIDDMTNLAKPFREALKAQYQISPLTLENKQVSQDGTVKYLFKLYDGNVVESVLMPFQDRKSYSVCISTQVGCAVGCQFCATAKIGWKRNLSVAEMVDQYLFVQADSGVEVRNVVVMGQGEPMLNLENLVAALKVLNVSAQVGMRRITVSTSGVVPKIYELAEVNLPITLAISLHAPDDATRERIMPITKKWKIAELMAALLHYERSTHRRVTVEYILLKGINDTVAHAEALGKLLQPLRCNVNLIPYNPSWTTDAEGNKVDKFGFERSSRNDIFRFMDTLNGMGKKTTVRLERGTDIAAACGQLANQQQQVTAPLEQSN